MEDDDEAHEVGDDEQQQRVPEPEELDDYPGVPHDLIVQTKYHVHVARMATDGMVIHYTYYCETLSKLLLIFLMYYSYYCENDVNFCF